MAPPATSGKDLLEARLLAMCMHSNVPEAMMNILGESGMTTVALMKNTIIDKDDWRDSLKKEPFNLSDADFAGKLKIGQMVSVYEAACATSDVEVKADAERLRQGLAPEIPMQEILQARKLFQEKEFEITDVMVPSKG